MTMSLVAKLKDEFGVRAVLKYGQCIVIPDAKFQEEWRTSLEKEGAEVFCHLELGGGVSTLVKLKPEHLSDERPVYSPEAQRREAAAVGTEWTDKDDKLIMQMWNSKSGVDAIAAEFPRRSKDAVKNHIATLQKRGKIKPRWTHGAKAKPKQKKEPASPQKTDEPSPRLFGDMDKKALHDLHRTVTLIENFVLINAVDELENLRGRGRVSEELYAQYVKAQLTTDYDDQLRFQARAKKRLNILMDLE